MRTELTRGRLNSVPQTVLKTAVFVHEFGAHCQVRAVYHTTAWVLCGHAALMGPAGAPGLLTVLAA